jgi:Domain of unknown function (DUF6438)
VRWIAVAALLAACGPLPSPAPASRARVVASLVRHECLERCPVYAIAIYADGVVQYDGVANVEVRGRRTAQLDARALDALRTRFAQFGWQRLTRYMNEDCTDQPWSTLSFDGRTVEHSYGDGSAPDDVAILESVVDDAAGSERWVGRGHFVFGLRP